MMASIGACEWCGKIRHGTGPVIAMLCSVSVLALK